MNKFRAISFASLCAVVLTTTSNSNIAKALSNVVYTFTGDDYKIDLKNKTLTLTFNNTDLHNKVTTIKLVDMKNNSSLTFNKNSDNFKLSLDKNLEDGIYSLSFYDKTSNSSKELVSPIYIDFPELSSQKLAVTSLNPIISLTNINGVNKLNARFNVLNIQDKITGARIIDENNSQIGYLENSSNPRSFIFNLGSSSLSSGKIYYIEYTLENANKETYKLKVPFSYSTNSVTLNQVNTNDFVFTSKENGDGTVDLTLNFRGVNNRNIYFSDLTNNESRITPSYDNSGNIVLKNLKPNSSIRVDINESDKNQTLVFRTPSGSHSNETPIPFIKFINSSNLNLKKNSRISIPIIKEDLVNVGFTTPNTYIKFIYMDDFGNEFDLTEERRISTSVTSVDITVNSNIESLTQDSQVYVKVYTPTKAYLYPFTVSSITSSSKSNAFDVIKENISSDSIMLTFRPNGDLLPQNEVFSDNDTLLINDSKYATLSADKKSFSVKLRPDELLNGLNSYTFISSRNNSSSVTGNFLVETDSSTTDIYPIVSNFSPKTNNQKELILNLNLDDRFLNNGINSSLKITDEFGNSLKSKFSVKQSGTDRYVEIIVEPANQMINGHEYNIEFNNGVNSFKFNFIYNFNSNYVPDLDLIFNSNSTFTLNYLDNLPGFSTYDFNIKIVDYYNQSNILYENFSQTYYGEKLTSPSITRNLKEGKYFVDSERYLVKITNVSTGDVYTEDFTFRENNIIPVGGSSSQINIPPSNLLNNNGAVEFGYAKPANKNIASIICNNQLITSYYSNGKVILDNLVPNKLYTNLSLNINFTDGTNQVVKLNEFMSPSSPDELKNYVAKVYTTALTPINETNKYRVRYADEEGFKYWYDMLSSQKISGPEFIYRILDENEFNNVHKTPQDKVRALYPIVVNRVGDTAGIEFWVKVFNETLASVNDTDLALKVTLAKMLNEEEPKKLFQSLGIRLS